MPTTTDTAAVYDFTVLTGLPLHTFEVHRATCSRVQARIKAGRPFVDSYPIKGSNVTEAIAADVADYEYQDQGYDADDYAVCPCARKVS